MRRALSRSAAGLLTALTVFAPAGCGGPAGTGDVRGAVTHAGKPVTAGVVKFFPESGGPPVSGAIGPDGNYRASGVPVGRCKVAVETLDFKHMTAPPKELAKQISVPRPVYVPIPAKYEKPESSGLAVEVKNGETATDLTVD